MFHFMFPDIADTYKNIHVDVYPKGMKKLVSYLVPRKSMLADNKMVVFGIQAFVKMLKETADEWFAKPTADVISDYQKKMNLQLGPGNYKTDHIESLHKLGYLPLKITAIPEGSIVPTGTPIVCVEAHDEYSWLAQWTECWMQSEIWKPCNDATTANIYYNIASYYYDKTTDGLDPRMAMSDFGMRGMSCLEEGCKTSAAWLTRFNKTSTVPAISWLDYYYDADCSFNHIGMGAVSIEHSVVSSNIANGMTEKELIKSLLATYKNFSYVADTYDYWNIVNKVLPSLKKEILKHDGKLLIRPDSGDQYENVIKTVQALWETFGGTENSKGYKVVNNHVGVILGDGCTPMQVKKIWKKLDSMKFAASNVVFGVGAFCFHAFFEKDKVVISTRDTFGFAQKTTYIAMNNGQELKVVKDPKTDTDKLKKSHKGLVYVKEEKGILGTKYEVIDDLTEEEFNEKVQEFGESGLRLIFENGKLCNKQTLVDIRERLNRNNLDDTFVEIELGD